MIGAAAIALAILFMQFLSSHHSILSNAEELLPDKIDGILWYGASSGYDNDDSRRKFNRRH
jgi:hypothetical protein